MEDRTHEIRDFLERPVYIDTFEWDTGPSQTTGFVLKTYDFPDALLTYIGNAAKIRGFYGFRADVELMVKINRQPFQAGMLMVSFCPNARYGTTKAKMHDNSLVTRSGSPRVVLNIKQDTEASLLVPYSSPFTYYNLTNKIGNIGRFYISIYSPLSDVAAAGKVYGAVFARFHNVDLQFPTGASPAFFGNASTGEGKKQQERYEAIEKYLQNQSETSFLELQRFVTQGNNDSIINVRPKTLPHMTEPTSSNTGHVISLNSDSRLNKAAVGETIADEMNMSKILSIPTYLTSFNWSNTQNVGARLLLSSVEPQPSEFAPVGGIIKADYIYSLAELFTFWHASVIYTFRIASTPYHSGRIRIWFSPGELLPLNLDRNAIYTQIIDLKDATDFQFTVPWCHPYPFLNTKNVVNSGTRLGYIGVDVLNTLVAPSTVSANITIVVERNFGPDGYFQLPSAISKAPYSYDTVTREKKQKQTLNQVIHDAVAENTRTQIPKPQTLVHFDIPGNSPILNRPDYQGEIANFIQQGAKYLSQKNRTAILEDLQSYTLEKVKLLDIMSNGVALTPNVLKMDLQTLRDSMAARNRAANPRLFKREAEEQDPNAIFTTQGAVDEAPSQDQARSGAPHPIFVRPKNAQIADSQCLDLKTNSVVDLLKRSTKFYNVDITSVNSTYVINYVNGAGSIIATPPSITHPALGNSIPAGTVTLIQPLVVMNLVSSTITVIPVGTIVLLTLDVGTNKSAKVEYSGVTYYVAWAINSQLTYIYNNSVPLTASLPTIDSSTRPMSIQPHFLGCAYSSGGNIVSKSVDNLSYLSSFFTFMRGGVTLRIMTQPTQLGIALDPSDAILTQTNIDNVYISPNDFKPPELFALNNTINQIVNTHVEGFAEFRVPFYANTNFISINNSNLLTNSALNNFQIPRTKLILDFFQSSNYLTIYRSVDEDFSLSYLSGPPVLAVTTN